MSALPPSTFQRHVLELVLLAIPLFIPRCGVHDHRSITERLLTFCNAFVGRFAAASLTQRRAEIVFAGMSGSALADAASPGKLMQKNDEQAGNTRRALPRPDRRILGHRAHHPAFDSDGDLRLVSTRPSATCSSAASSRACSSASRRWSMSRSSPSEEFPGRESRPAAAISRASRGDAFPALMMPVVLFGCLYSGIPTPTEAAALAACTRCWFPLSCIARHLGRVYKSLVTSARSHIDRHSDRRRDGLQLRHHGETFPRRSPS